MDVIDQRKHLRGLLHQFKTFEDVSYLIGELFQRDSKTLKRMFKSLRQSSGKAENLKAFLTSLEDKIVGDSSPERLLNYIAFIDLVVFHLYKSHVKWKTHQLEDANNKYKSPIEIQEIIRLRNRIKESLPSQNINSVQQLLIRHSSEKDNIPLQSLFRVTSFTASKSDEKNPSKLLLRQIKAKPFYLCYFNGLPYIFSPIILQKPTQIKGILGAFESSELTHMGLTSTDILSLYYMVKNKDVSNTPKKGQGSVRSPIKKRIILNDLYIESNSLHKEQGNTNEESLNYKGSMRTVIRFHGEDIYEGLKELKKHDVMDDSKSNTKWIDNLPSIKANYLRLQNNKLLPSKSPMLLDSEWNERIKFRRPRKRHMSSS